MVLNLPEDLPFRTQMYHGVQTMLQENDPDLSLTFMDCDREGIDTANLPECFLDSGYPEIKSGYRASSGITLHQLIELEKNAFINKHFPEIKRALTIPFWDFKRKNAFYITQFDELLTNPYDAEIGTLYRMCHLRQAEDRALYLLYLPEEEAMNRLALLRDIRNILAHNEACIEEKISEFFSQYSYAW